jgi:hypothetical protein
MLHGTLLAVVIGSLAVLACDGGADDPSSTTGGSSGAASSSSSGASGTSGSEGIACITNMPTPSDPNPAPGCAADDECTVRPTGPKCCPQGDVAMTRAVAEALAAHEGPYCGCHDTPCAPREPTLSAHCDKGVCKLGPRADAGPSDGGNDAS